MVDERRNNATSIENYRSSLASVMGATLLQRTTAERLAKGVNRNALVIEPYANPLEHIH